MPEDKKAEIKDELLKETRDGRIACRRALQLAERLGVAPGEVGQVAEEQGIKIASCQLGCF